MEKKSKRLLYSLFGFIFLFFGFSYILNFISGIEGFIILEDADKKINGFAGMIFIFIGLFFLSKIPERKVRGQAALEFLFTYGWAVLSTIIAVGALAYFGAFKVEPPEALALSPSLGGGSFQIYTDIDSETLGEQPGIQIELKNNEAESMRINEITVNGGDTTCQYSGSRILEAGKKGLFLLECQGFLKEGSLFTGVVEIKFIRAGRLLEVSSSGRLTGKARNTQFNPEICNNGVDDDGDDLVDCQDSDCDGQVCSIAGSQCSVNTCIEVICTDSQDNDGDSFVDCADSDCSAEPSCLGGGFAGPGF